VSGESTSRVRSFLSRRFPALADAPLLEARVCQYENTWNGDFLIDRHPDYENVWIAGGGSGHGFKHGPAVGAYVADLVTGDGTAEPRFALASKQAVQQRSVY
jgi:glycine/D-amino acid oxidase-like deaminating enzyme